MEWVDIRQSYPNQWLLVEALKAHSESQRRIIQDLAVVSTFESSTAAMHGYAEFHRKIPDRELYVFHTSREVIDVPERQWLGIRCQ